MLSLTDEKYMYYITGVCSGYLVNMKMDFNFLKAEFCREKLKQTILINISVLFPFPPKVIFLSL